MSGDQAAGAGQDIARRFSDYGQEAANIPSLQQIHEATKVPAICSVRRGQLVQVLVEELLRASSTGQGLISDIALGNMLRGQRKDRIRIDQFEATELLGEGGNGRAYRGKFYNEEVAVKILNPDVLQELVFGELNMLKRLEHPNIVRLIGACFRINPTLIIEAAYADTDKLVRVDQFDLLEVTAAATQTLSALDYIHRKMILHLDLKPGNILVTRDNVIKVADMGISKELPLSRNFIETKGVLGTPGYIPHRSFSQEIVSFGTDLFGVGCCVFEWTTGTTLLPCQLLNDDDEIKAFYLKVFTEGMKDGQDMVSVEERVREEIEEPLLCDLILSCISPDGGSFETILFAKDVCRGTSLVSLQQNVGYPEAQPSFIKREITPKPVQGIQYFRVNFPDIIPKNASDFYYDEKERKELTSRGVQAVTYKPSAYTQRKPQLAAALIQTNPDVGSSIAIQSNLGSTPIRVVEMTEPPLAEPSPSPVAIPPPPSNMLLSGNDEAGQGGTRKGLRTRRGKARDSEEQRPVEQSPVAKKRASSGHTAKTVDTRKRKRCPKCEARVQVGPNFTRHVKTCGQRPYKCEQCDQSFARQDTLRNHEKTHLDEFDHPCPSCSRKFRKQALGMHRLREHPKDIGQSAENP